MKKLYGLCAALAAIAVLFAGCPDPNKDDETNKGDTTTVAVTSVSITKSGTIQNAPLSMYTDDDDLQLGFSVLPSSATDKTVTWSSSADAVATVDQTGKVHPIADGSTTIKVVTNGKKADGSSAEFSVNVTVTERGEVVETKLVLFNQEGTLDGTTTVLPTFDSKGRITIKNTSTTGGWGTNTNQVKGNTFVYLNEMQSAPFAISARIKIKSLVAAAGTDNGVLVGAFTDPKVDTQATSAPNVIHLAGINTATTGRRSVYTTRGNPLDNSALGTSQFTASTEKEYYFTVSRTDEIFTMKVVDDAITPPLAAGSYGSAGITRTGDTQVHANLTGSAPLYLGFLISGVEVEISSIKIIQGITTVYESPAATATPIPPIIGITITNTDSTVSVGQFLTMSCSVQPEGADNRITWSIEPPAPLVASIDAATGVLTGVGAGEVTVYATSVANNTVKSTGFKVTVSMAQEVLENNRSWNFQKVPGGATDGSYFQTDLYYNQGMTLLGTGRTNGIRVATPAHADGSATEIQKAAGLTDGFLQPNGACPTGYAKIEKVQGPFDITLKFHANAADTRYSQIKIGEVVTDTSSSTAATDPKVFTYSYTGTDKVDIVLQTATSVNPGRIHDVIIEYKGN